MVDYKPFIPLFSGLIILFTSNRYVNNYQRKKDKVKIRQEIINELILAWQDFSKYLKTFNRILLPKEIANLHRDLLVDFSLHLDTCKGLLIVYGKELTYFDEFEKFNIRLREVENILTKPIKEAQKNKPIDQENPVKLVSFELHRTAHKSMNEVFNDWLKYLRTIEIGYNSHEKSIYAKSKNWIRRNFNKNSNNIKSNITKV
ncbi:hypothetical protein LCGC14_2762310 [marine sediment metagenome]|uniref:DUF4760 domain-containing protein n=1 Tax=marine sediment metagenome TaxID=412755 RepID=A0A0F8ZKI0_9ZZZZ